MSELRGYAFGAILVVLAGLAVLWAYASGNDSRLTNDTVNMVSSVRQSVTELYSSARSFTDIAVADVLTALPKSMKNTAGTAIINPFKGTVSLAAGTVNTDGDAFQVILTGIPQAACLQLATKDFGRSAIKVGAGPTLTAVSATSGSDVPMTPAAARAACSASTNSIGWLFM